MKKSKVGYLIIVFLVGLGVGAVLFLPATCSPSRHPDNGKRAGDTGTKLNQAIRNGKISAGITDSKVASAIGSASSEAKTANRCFRSS